MLKTSVERTVQLKVADEVWIATAFLHKEQPKRADFTVREIVARAQNETPGKELRPGVRVHASMHCVANRAPDPGAYRMLFATGKLTRRLFRPGDTFHPDRHAGKIVPRTDEIPSEYHDLIRWYEDEYVRRNPIGADGDPLLALRGSGRKLWADEHADEYV